MVYVSRSSSARKIHLSYFNYGYRVLFSLIHKFFKCSISDNGSSSKGYYTPPPASLLNSHCQTKAQLKRITCCPNRNHNLARVSQWWGTKNPRVICNTAPGEILRVGLMGRGWRCRPRVAPSPHPAITPGQPPPSGALYTRTRPLGNFFLWMPTEFIRPHVQRSLKSLFLWSYITKPHSHTHSLTHLYK